MCSNPYRPIYKLQRWWINLPTVVKSHNPLRQDCLTAWVIRRAKAYSTPCATVSRRHVVRAAPVRCKYATRMQHEPLFSSASVNGVTNSESDHNFYNYRNKAVYTYEGMRRTQLTQPLNRLIFPQPWLQAASLVVMYVAYIDPFAKMRWRHFSLESS